MDRFACLLIQDLPLAAVLRAEPECAAEPDDSWFVDGVYD